MPRQMTKATRFVKLSEHRIREIEQLVTAWPYETKAFMRARLNQYKPSTGMVNTILEGFLSFIFSPQEKRFTILKDPEILTDWQRRFELSGQTNPQDAWNKIIEKEVTAKDYEYLLYLLDEALSDIHVPGELAEIFEKIYRAHVRKEYIADPSVPKAPLVLVSGPSGSGKTATVHKAIESVVFGNRVLPEIDLDQKREEILAPEPFWKTIEEIDPTLALAIERKKRLTFNKTLSRIPLVRRLLKKRISRNLAALEEQGVLVDYAVVTPNDYQTALAGEPGNYFKKALGDPRKPAIRHIEEAHSAFGKSESQSGAGPERQQRTLIDTANIVIDEIISGQRDCLMVATSDQPDRFDGAIYRRFVEKGAIIDISEYWKNPENLKQIVRLELHRHDIRVTPKPECGLHDSIRCISPEDLCLCVDRLYEVFRERSLKITPAYVRKLVSSILEMKGDFSPGYLSDPLLVRQAFELVARNTCGDLYSKVVDRLDRQIRWEEYVGDIKNLFSEMANNCLFYGVSEEKGVVLSGPPGSGKTFLVRCWLSENSTVHDISTSPSALQDPMNPIDGTLKNLEKVYDIAKMIAPSVVFFDEGDALAPKRSPSGGSPSDKLTNRFLNLIDGEIPLNRVFTTLTTNRLDILDPALVRSKRLKVLEISGHLTQQDITDIIKQKLIGIPLAGNVDETVIYDSAKGMCNTPADYSAFVEKARSIRSTEYEVLNRARALLTDTEENRENFVKFNYKTLMGMLNAVDVPDSSQRRFKGNIKNLLNGFGEFVHIFEHIAGPRTYPLVRSHLQAARTEIAQSPVKKGKVQLDEFLEAELSQEPQVGFIIGVGANEVTGVLLPIATSLTYSLSPEKILVTGAVSSATAVAAELDMAVQMTQQSAKEALTLVKNYFQSLDPKVSIPKLLGEFLDKYTIHHQLLSASYQVGGPSAGYALALNTLSALLQIPVCNDFGITGAPWTKGVKRGEVGGSVIIGGHRKKAEKVLQHLRRMYMPLQNYRDLEPEFLAGYWLMDKDILGVTHFGDLAPELVWLGQEYDKTLQRLISERIEYKLKKQKGKKDIGHLKQEILEKKALLRNQFETEILSRLSAIRNYLRDPVSDPHLSLEEIFKEHHARGFSPIKPFISRLKKKFRRQKILTS